MDVKFFFNPELNESVTVRPDGLISLQLANELPAAGLTPVELSQELKRSYARELNNPELTVILRKFAGQRVYVGGEVNKPGFVALAPEMTVLQSLQMAGGLKDSARRNEIVVVRRQPQGKPQVFTLDLDQVLSGSNTGEDVALRPLDVVYAPKSPIADVNLWVDQYLRQNLPIQFGLFF
jgi:polysaccharide export outer membrane protein